MAVWAVNKLMSNAQWATASFARSDKLKHVPRGACFSLPKRNGAERK
jgi:hypothetical protein